MRVVHTLSGDSFLDPGTRYVCARSRCARRPAGAPALRGTGAGRPAAGKRRLRPGVQHRAPTWPRECAPRRPTADQTDTSPDLHTPTTQNFSIQTSTRPLPPPQRGHREPPRPDACPPSHPPSHSHPALPPPLNPASHPPASATAPRPQSTRPLPRHSRLGARHPSARAPTSPRSDSAAQHTNPTSNQKLLPASTDHFTTRTGARPPPGPPPEPQRPSQPPPPTHTHDSHAPREPSHTNTHTHAHIHEKKSTRTHPQPISGSRIGRSREDQQPKPDPKAPKANPAQ